MFHWEKSWPGQHEGSSLIVFATSTWPAGLPAGAFSLELEPGGVRRSYGKTSNYFEGDIQVF